MKRRIVSLLMCLVMVLSLLPTEVWAEVLPEQDAAQQTTAENGGQEDGKKPAANAAASQSGESGVSVQAAAVAEADGRSFATLQDAFDYAWSASRPTIKLLDDVTLDNYVYLDTGCSATLDLNGKTVSRQQNTNATGVKTDSVFLVESGCRLTIKDTAGGGQIVQPNIFAAVTANGGTVTIESGTIKATSTDAENNRAIEVSSGTVTINGGTIEGAQIGVRTWGGSKLIVNGGTIHGETSYALLTSGTVELSGGTFNTGVTDGYSIWNEKGTAASLLKSGYAYMTDAGEESPLSEDGYKVEGKTTVKTAPERVSYIGADGKEQGCAKYEVVTSETNGLTEGWYVVKENASVLTLYLNGYNSTTNLILCDGATLTVSFIDAIQIENVTLNIYLQSGGTGKLVVEGGITLAGELPTVNRLGTPMKLVNEFGDAASSLTSYFEISKCDHDGFTYTEKNEKNHTGTCAYCGTALSGEHDFTWAYKDAGTHMGTCKVCGYKTTVEHEMRYTDNHDGLTHKSFCRDCTLTSDKENHRFQYITYGKCVDCNAEPAAQVGDQIYSSLPIALDAAKDGDTVKLLADYTTDESDLSTYIFIEKKLTLDLNGKTIDYLGVGQTWDLSASEPTALETPIPGDLTITDTGSGEVGRVPILVFAKGELTITGGEIGDKGDSGSFICSDETGEVNIKGGVVWYFRCEGGTANITGGKVFALSMGGSQTVVNISGGTNHGGWNNGVAEYDSATWSIGGGTLNISGGTFGKIYFDYTGGTVNISGGIFGSIANGDGNTQSPLLPLLADGHAFFGKDADDKYTVLQDGSAKQLENVTVKPHTHTIENGKCACGMAFVASVTAEGKDPVYYATLEEAFKKADWDNTVTLLADVALIAPLAIVSGEFNHHANNFTLDLNGKTISCAGTDTTSVFTSATLTICDSSNEKTGEIKQNDNFYALQSGQGGKLTITGGKFGRVGIFGDAEISGGTFSEICAFDLRSSPEKLHTVLKDGYAFANSDGSIVNGYENTNAKDVTVVEHKAHTYEADGKCACGAECPHTSWENGKCKDCGFACTHDKGVNADVNCVACGAAIVAKVEVSGKTTYHADMTAALEAAKDNGTLTVIAKEQTVTLPDENGYPVLCAEGTLTLDLNGHTLSGGGLMVGGYVGVSTRTGNLTVIDSIGGGKVDGERTGLKVQPGAKVKFDGAACSKLAVYSQTYQPAEVKFCGGVIHEITVLDGATCADLLAEGYCFYSYDETTAKVGDAVKLATLDGQTKVTTPLAVAKCSHTEADNDGKCVYCGTKLAVRDSNGVIYGSLTEAINAALSDSSIKWVQLDADMTESVVFDAEGKSVTVKMNGKTLTSADGVPLTVKNGTLTIADAANITRTGETNSASDCAVSITGGELIFAGDLTALGGSSTDSASPAIAVTGGKVTFAGKVTATGGLQGVRGNAMTCKPAVYATGGELDFKGDLDLNGGLTITGSAKLTNGLRTGLFRAKYDEESVSANRVSVEGSANYGCLGALLADGYAFVKTDDQTQFPCTSASMRSWSGDVTIAAHEHTWGPGSGDLFWCTVCKLICDHPGGFASGKCEVCGMPCPHASLDDTGSGFRCRACDQIMVAKITTKNNEGYDLTNYYANLVDALKAVKNGETVTLLSDIDNSGKYAILTGDNKTVTLDLNGKTVTGGWIQVGIDRNWSDQTSSTLKVIGSGSLMTSGNLSVGYKATLDLSGWGGGENDKISNVGMSKNGKVNPNLESTLIVSENTGTIGTLGFYSWPSAGVKTKLNGGTYGSISIVVQYNSEPFGSLLAPGYAFQYIDSGEFVEYGKTATNRGNTINNVKVVKCPHPESAATDATGSCAYCNTEFEAKKTDDNGAATYIKVGELKSTDFESGSVMLLRDVSKGILYCRATATLDLNGHSLMASAFTITGTCTLKDSNPKANYIQSINIGTDRDADAGSLIIEPGTNVPVEKLTVCGSKNTKLAGGRFGSIIIDYTAKTGYWKIDSAADLLAEGYAYATLQGVVNGYQDTLTEVRVVEHEHAFDSNYKCGCGLTCAHETYNSTTGQCTVCGRQMAASVNGQYYESLDAALEALKGNDNSTLKLFANCQYGNTALNSNALNYTVLTIDLNGHDLYGVESSSKLITVVDGAKLTIKDTSTAQNGSVDNIQITLGNSSSGKLTLESGAIDSLQVSPGSDIRLREGGKLRHLTTGGDQYAFPVATLLSSSCGLVDENDNWADLGRTSVGSVTGDGYYTVKEVKDVGYVGGNSTSAETPAGRNTLPFDLQLVFLLGAGGVSQVKFQWYRADTNRDMLAGSAATPARNGDFIYDKTTEGSGSGWTDLTTGKTAKLVCVATGLDAAGNTLWCMSAGKYDLTIGKGDLSDATITFPDGNVSVFDPANELTNARGITVTHNGKTLTEGKDYTVSGNTADKVGTHQLTITAVEGSDYVGEKSAQWTVRPYQLAPAVGDTEKQYDGTTDLPESASITLVGADPDDSTYFGKTLPATVDFAVTNARYDSANAGTEEKTISFTVSLKDKNFIFTDGTIRREFTVKGSETVSTFKINKADAPKMTVASALVVTNDQAGTYELTLPDLPTLKSPCEYGDVSYSANGDALMSIYRDAVTELKVVQESGQYKLKLTIDAVNTTAAGSAGTVRVKVATANYQDITLDIGVKARNKLIPVGSPTLTPSAITYGQTVGIIALSGDMKAEGKTVTGTFTWDAPDAKPNKAGSYDAKWTFTPTDTAEYQVVHGTTTITVNRAPLTDVSVLQAAALTYNGEPQRATVTTTGKTVDGTPVVFRYSTKSDDGFTKEVPQFTNAGTYTVYYQASDEGQNHVVSTGSFTVTIAAKNISEADIVLGDKLTYNGQKQTQSIKSVTVDGLTVTYDVTGDKNTDAGKYQLTITGNGNFTGSVMADYSIAAKNISKADIKLGKELTYNGQLQTQTIDSVMVDDLKVTYTVSGDKNTDAGKYQLTITGTGNFTGSAKMDYTIARKDIGKAKIALGDKLIYNGEEQTQTITSVTVDGLDVTYTVSGDKNTKAGKYQLTVTGTGNFIGTATADYTIADRDISKAEIKLGAALTYNGEEQTQTIESVTVDGLDVTYTVSGDKATKAGEYTLTVTGTGDFTGTATAKYTIAARNISDAKIVLGDKLTYNGKEQTQNIASVTVDNLPVTYTVSGNKATNAGTYTLTVTGTDNFTGTATAKYTIAAKNIADAKIVLGEELIYNGQLQTKAITSVTVDGLPVTYDVAGDKQTNAGSYTLTVTGNGNFTGTATADYTIAVKDITGAQITLGDKLTYNGKEQTQSIASVTVDDLDVTYTVTGDKATNAGDYTLTITANGNFAGTLTADYTIARKDIQDAVVDAESPIYTGKIQAPKINGVTVDDMTLVEGTDYTALTRDAVSAGSYAMKLIGMGNFTGAADRTFTVLKAEALMVEPIRVDVTNDYAASYTVDLRAALNGVLPEGCSFGTVNYGSLRITSDPSGYCGNTAVSSNGILTLAVAQVSSDTEGLAATVEIPVETANYRQMTVTVELYAVNKLIPTGAPTPSKTTLNYGDALSSIRLRGSMRSGSLKVPGTFAWAEPDLRPAAGEYEATWVFTPNDSKYATVTGTITITVKEPSQPTYRVGGIVKGFSVVDNEELTPISGAVVTICKGLTVLGGRKLTDENGLFDLDGVLPGVYNVVVEYQGKTVTTKVELTDHDVDLKVLLPEEDVNSELEIKNAGSLTRSAVVGGLDAEASLRFTEDGTLDGGSVLVSMEIREQPTDKNDEVQNAIRKAVKVRNLEFVDLTLTLVKNGVETTLPESGTVLEIILSCDANRKLVIARQEADENGQMTVKELTESDTGAEGTYYVDKANKQIHLFVSRLSTYAIGYYGTTGSGGGSGSTDASGTTADGIKSANTGDVGLLPYAVMALSACTGVTVLRFRRKRED